jgi:K+-sensing histidine kinase KdpD
VINEESDRLNRLVGEAGEVAQLNAHQLHFRFETHRMPEAIDQALKNSEPALRTHPVQVSVPCDLPPVRMDLERTTEVISQLLDNAGKYSPANAPIHVSVELQGSEVITSVADQGPGIDEMEQEMIFEKFYRGRDQRMLMPAPAWDFRSRKPLSNCTEARSELSVSWVEVQSSIFPCPPHSDFETSYLSRQGIRQI